MSSRALSGRYTATDEVILSDTGLPTYVASGAAYAAYATPTDLLTITGSATKIIRIVQMQLLPRSTSAALQNISFIRRSAANTGGTSTTPTGFPVDSADPAATAVVNLYSAAPTLGTALTTLGVQRAVSGTLTGAPGSIALSNVVLQSSSILFHKPIILRGITESLCMNYGGAALTAGFSAEWTITWTESDY